MAKVKVRLVDVPVALFAASEQHTNDLLREIALMASDRSDVEYRDLLAAADTFAHRPADVRERMARSVRDACGAGRDSVTVDFHADTTAADGVLAWEELLRRFDTMSRQERLLTLPAGEELTAYRTWYVRELVEQVRTGRLPVSWDRARHLATAGAP